jgi:adenosylcobinamide-phosphate synthase
VSLFAPLAALAWEHFRPYAPHRPALEIARGHRWILENFNAGGEQHGMLAWTLGALFPALLLGLLASVLGAWFAWLGWAFEVLALYFLFGFRRASFHAASIARALTAGDLAHARRRLIEWNPALLAADGLDDLARQCLEETLKAALRTLFGILFWYWLAGIAGAVLYALSHACRDQWQSEDVFVRFTRQVVYWIDWLPARALGFSFAIVGNFQDATECWRDQASKWLDDNEGVILAAGAGALGIRLGGAIQVAQSEVPRPEMGMIDPPGPESIDAGVALIWRAALLWLAVAGLLWLGGL